MASNYMASSTDEFIDSVTLPLYVFLYVDISVESMHSKHILLKLISLSAFNKN